MSWNDGYQPAILATTHLRRAIREEIRESGPLLFGGSDGAARDREYQDAVITFFLAVVCIAFAALILTFLASFASSCAGWAVA